MRIVKHSCLLAIHPLCALRFSAKCYNE